MKDHRIDSHFFSDNAAFVEGIYEDYLTDRSSVDSEWVDYFDGLSSAAGTSKTKEVLHSQVRDYFLKSAKTPKIDLPELVGQSAAVVPATQQVDVEELQKQDAVIRLINEYRHRGHMLANLDPLQLLMLRNFVPFL